VGCPLLLIVPSLSICEDVNGEKCKGFSDSMGMMVSLKVFGEFSGLFYVFILVRHNSSELFKEEEDGIVESWEEGCGLMLLLGVSCRCCLRCACVLFLLFSLFVRNFAMQRILKIKMRLFSFDSTFKFSIRTPSVRYAR
jgi:hypothetical protein